MFGEKVNLKKPIQNPSSDVLNFDKIQSDWYKKDDSESMQILMAEKDEGKKIMDNDMKIKATLEDNKNNKDLTYF